MSSLPRHEAPINRPAAWRVQPTWTSLLPKGVRSCPPLGSADGHTTYVSAVVTTVLDGRPVAVTGSGDNTVRVWDLSTGELIGAPWTGHTNTVRALAMSVLDGRPVVVSGGDDGTVRVWELASGKPVGEPFHLQDGVRALAIAERHGRQVVVTACYHTPVGVWDLETRQEVMAPIRGHSGPVYAVATAVLDGRWVAVTSGRTVRVWDLDTGDPVGSPFTRDSGHVSALAVTELTPGHPVVVSGGYQTTTRVSDLATGLPVGDLPRSVDLKSVTTTVMDNRPLAITCTSDEPTIQVWDLRTAELVDELYPQHPRTLLAVATAVMDGRQVVVSSCDGGSVRVSDLVVDRPADKPERHDAAITAVATTSVAGRPVAVTGSADATVRAWDLETGDQVCRPLTDHTGPITVVAATQVDGRAVALAGGKDGEARVWDLALGKAAGAPLAAHRGPITAIAADDTDDPPRAITAGDDKTIRVWDLRTGEETGNPRKSDHRSVQALTTTTLDDRPVALLGRRGGGFRVRDLTANRDTQLQTTGSNGKPVRLVAATLADGRPIAVTTNDDWRDPWTKVWDVATAQQIGQLRTTYKDVYMMNVDVLAATTIDGHPIALTASQRTVAAWSLATFDRIIPDLAFPDQVNAVAATPQGHVIVCFGRDIAVLTMARSS
ncbi:WD40 repeat domain-containing protein [Nonomuraea bangladeshensis]|uniref:WD40 repeat domain-containing protein n=1 Tax=Nonomuraea bangladeshensis TaxID=404385 RepID=UPI003C305968